MKNFSLALASIGLTAFSWGVYGPLMQEGAKAMGHSRLLPFIGVGVAYFVIAVLAAGGLLRARGESGQWSTAGDNLEPGGRRGDIGWRLGNHSGADVRRQPAVCHAAGLWLRSGGQYVSDDVSFQDDVQAGAAAVLRRLDPGDCRCGNGAGLQTRSGENLRNRACTDRSPRHHAGRCNSN